MAVLQHFAVQNLHPSSYTCNYNTHLLLLLQLHTESLAMVGLMYGEKQSMQIECTSNQCFHTATKTHVPVSHAVIYLLRRMRNTRSREVEQLPPPSEKQYLSTYSGMNSPAQYWFAARRIADQ